MTIKTKLALNTVITLVLVSGIVATALLGINFVKGKITLLTNRSTPFQTRTLEQQRAIQATVGELIKLSTSETPAEMAVSRTEAEKTLTMVKTATDALAALTGEETRVFDELSDTARELTQVTDARLKAEQNVKDAITTINRNLGDADNRLKDLEKKIGVMQSSRAEVFTGSRQTSDTTVSWFMESQALKVLFKDLQVALLEIHTAGDGKALATAREKFGNALAGALQNDFAREREDAIYTVLKTFTAKGEELGKLKGALLGSAGDDVRAKYDVLRRSMTDAMASMVNFINQEVKTTQEQMTMESKNQGTMFGDLNTSTGVLSGTAALVALGSSLEGETLRLFNAMTVKELDAGEAGVKHTCERITKVHAGLEKSLKTLNAGKEINTLKLAVGSLGAVRGNLLAADGIVAKLRHKLAMRDKAIQAMDKLKVIVVKQTKTGEMAITTAKSEQEKAIISVGSMVRFNRMALIAIGIGSVLISLIIGYLLHRSITGPLNTCIAAVDRIADGDLTVEVGGQRKDELGIMLDAVRRMSENLKRLIHEVRSASEALAASSSEQQSLAVQMATGAEQVAAQAGTVATASEEMAATSQDIARNCYQAAESSQQANGTALSGAALLKGTLDAMNAITAQVRQSAETVEQLGKRSEQIEEIITTINDIADQTNLLALNAAIEAARAGDAGRGFAVVADEVRALAERTATATHEIGGMIKAIQSETGAAVKSMDVGVREVEKVAADASRSGESLQEIVSRIGDVTMQVNQIATAAEEQTATTNEISNNILQIREVVEGTARGAQGSATAASRMADLSANLQRLIGRFRI